MYESDELIQDNIALLEMGIDVISKLGEEYSSTPPAGLRGTIGAHFRHCVDFYTNFLDSFESGVIDYDNRSRESELESDANLAMEAFRDIIDSLREHQLELAERRVSVRLEGSAITRSTVGRELLSLLSHTVHHHAMVALMLRLQGVECPTDFGVAPSTLRYWRKSA